MTTPAQVAALQAWYNSGAALVSAITPCTTPPPVVDVGQYTEYCAAFLGVKSYYVKNVNADGSSISGAVAAVSAVVDQSSPAGGRIIWGPTGEHHATLNGWEIWQASEVMSSGVIYPLEQVFCTWTDMVSGITTDVTNVLGTGPVGTMMHPLVVPASGHCRIVQYGWAWSAPPPAGFRSGPFYWQADYFYGLTTTDNAWYNPATATRQVIRMNEAWWDASGVWTRATGGTGTQAPWVLTNDIWTRQPVVNVTYLGQAELARGLGAMWSYQYPDYRAALYNAM